MIGCVRSCNCGQQARTAALRRGGPSEEDSKGGATVNAIALEPSKLAEVGMAVGAGRMRGLLLHRLMEEMLWWKLAFELDHARQLIAGWLAEGRKKPCFEIRKK